MIAKGTPAATDGASSGGRRLDHRFFVLVSLSLALGPLAGAGCTRSGTQDDNQRAAQTQAPAAAVDPALARAVGAAVQPCIRAHRTPAPSVYTAQLLLERRPAGTAAATFTGERTAGHADFEACAVKAIDAAAIAIPRTTTLPVAFDFGPER